jgi:hypothetical protein
MGLEQQVRYIKTYVYLYLATFFFEWEMFQAKLWRKFKEYILYTITYFHNLVFYEIMWKNMVEPEMPQLTI